MRPLLLPSLLAATLMLAGSAVTLAGNEDGNGEEPAENAVPETTELKPRILEGEGASLDDEMTRIDGMLQAGWRWVGGDSGRYDRDVNLHGGPRLMAGRLDLHTSGDNGVVDHIGIRGDGVGDPVRRFELNAHRIDAWDLKVVRLHQEYRYRGTYDPNPYDTVRANTDVDLTVRATDDLTLLFGVGRTQRHGDARIKFQTFGDESLSTDAPVDEDFRRYRLGFDAQSGKVRFGAHQSWGRGNSELLRTLDRPDTPQNDVALYLTDTGSSSAASTGYVGVGLAGGVLDLEVRGGYITADSDSDIYGREVYSVDGGDEIDPSPDDFDISTETRGNSDASRRDKRLEALATVRPLDPLEVILHWERDSARERSGLLMKQRVQVPAFDDPAGPFFGFSQDLRTRTLLQRWGAETVWRPHKAWRVRGGAEYVQEKIEVRGISQPDLSPKTTVGTLGADVRAHRDLDVSALARHADAGGEAKSLSTETSDMLSLRLRSRPAENWHATGWVRVDERSERDARSDVNAQAFGIVVGHETDAGWVELTASRHRFVVASDTRFVVDSTIDPVKSPHRVRYSELANVVSLDFSREVSGALRGFGSLSWAHASGDLPSTAVDGSLGLGWRFDEDTELRLEGRHIAYRERDRNVDDYVADVVTLSVVWEF